MYIITPFLPNERNGVSKSLKLFLERINKKNRTIHIITSRPSLLKNNELLKKYSVEFIELEIKNIKKPISYLKNIKKYLHILRNIRNTKILCICWHSSLTNLLSLFCNQIDKSVEILFYSHGTNSSPGALPLSAKSIFQTTINFIFRITLMKKLLDKVSYLYVLTNTYDSARIDDIKYLIKAIQAK